MGNSGKSEMPVHTFNQNKIGHFGLAIRNKAGDVFRKQRRHDCHSSSYSSALVSSKGYDPSAPFGGA